MSNPTKTQQTVIIAGAGLAGALMGCYLGQAGYRVKIFERRGDPRLLEDAGRSINLALSTRGLHALREVGLEQEILRVAVPMRGRMMHSADGDLTFQPYGTDPNQYINSVSRLGLNILLVEAAEAHPAVSVQFHQRCIDVDFDRPSMKVRDESTGAVREEPCDVLLGADGAFSAIRTRMQKTDRFDYQQSYLEHGYKELTIPAGSKYGDKLEKNALHIWPRGGYMMIALPNIDGSFTCTLFWPFEGPNSFGAIQNERDMLDFFVANFPDAVPWMPDLKSEYFENPTSSLVTIRCSPWSRAGKVGLIGDACHAIVPFYGQGANAAFEDCTVLAECLKELGPDWGAVLPEYERRRKVNVDALAQLAVDNFLEMRDKVANPMFLARKRFEKFLHKLMPARYIPLYIMVTFTRIPYAEARRRADWQWLTVKRIGAAAVAFAVLAVSWLIWRWS